MTELTRPGETSVAASATGLLKELSEKYSIEPVARMNAAAAMFSAAVGETGLTYTKAVTKFVGQLFQGMIEQGIAPPLADAYLPEAVKHWSILVVRSAEQAFSEH